MHTTGGYLVYAAMTLNTYLITKTAKPSGVLLNVGWITGHTYLVYGPLANGAKTILFERCTKLPEPDPNE
ncbi:hypothetical protein OK016_07965 [Vibrio chagasii]|nr:hypothetical protein [Vibrio chagasii]